VVTYVARLLQCMKCRIHAMALLLAPRREKIPFSNKAGAKRAAGRCRRLVPLAPPSPGRCWAWSGSAIFRARSPPRRRPSGLEVIAHDPYAAGDVFASCLVEAGKLRDTAGAIGFHIGGTRPLTPATRGLINAATPSPG